MTSTVAPDRFLILAEPDGKELYQVVEFAGCEALSSPFEFRLQLRRPIAAGDPVASLTGKEAEVRVQLADGKMRKIRGIVRDFVRKRRDARYHRALCVLVPRIWPAAMNRRCRIFQDKTAYEIIEEILRPYVVEWRCSKEGYDRRNTCVQYMESDFAFAQRLMEEEGIHYFFDHARESKLVVSDQSTSNPPLVEPNRLKFSEARGQFADGGRIYWLDASEAMTAPSLRLRDQSFQSKEPPISVEAAVFPGKPGRGGQWNEKWGERLESFGAVAHRFDEYGPNGSHRPADIVGLTKAVQRVANLRAQSLASEFARTLAESDYLHVAPGLIFELTDAEAEDNGRYLIVGVEHDYRLAESAQWQIGNRIECLRAETSFRPPLRTPRPRIRGAHSAIVVGPKDATIWTDPYGRVQVRFFWEDGEEHTCWLRVAQNWAGDQYGAVMTPRVGNEVLVGFLLGDPDQPVVVKSLYNANNLPAYEPSAEATTAGFYSRSNKADAKLENSSHFLFVDAPGREQVHLHSERHLHVSSEFSMVETVGWGSGKSGELSYLSGNSQTVAGNVWSDVKQSIFGGGKWQAGYVSKTKGVDRSSIWGHQIDVTLGTSSHFNVGAWLNGNLGLGVNLDAGFRTDVALGIEVSLNVAPQYVFAVGDYFDYATGQRYVRSGSDVAIVVGGDYVEKIAGSRLTMTGRRMPEHIDQTASGTIQCFDIGGFHLFAKGPELGSPDFDELGTLAYQMAFAKEAKTVLALDEYVRKAHMNMLPRGVSYPDNPDAVIDGATAAIAAIREKYGIQIIEGFGDVVIGARATGGALWLYGNEVELLAGELNIYAEKECHFHGLEAKAKLVEAKAHMNQAEMEAHVIPAIEKPKMDAKLTATQGAGFANAAVAIPGVIIAGAALAGGIYAATNHDPGEWGL